MKTTKAQLDALMKAEADQQGVSAIVGKIIEGSDLPAETKDALLERLEQSVNGVYAVIHKVETKLFGGI